MAKHLNLIGTDYRISTDSEHEIILDPTPTGNVRVIGNLVIEGESTTVESENLAVSDNIISVNTGETGNGISANGGIAGLAVDRGTYVDALLLFREGLTWLSPSMETFSGAFSLEDANGDIIALRTNAITTEGGNLFLINAGSGVISVAGTVDYETNVVDDDHIPNKKYVDDTVTYKLENQAVRTVGDGTLTQTYIRALDEETTQSASLLEVGIDTIITTQFYTTYTKMFDLEFSQATIYSSNLNSNLKLSTTGTGRVEIDNGLLLNDLAETPIAPDQGTTLYGDGKGTGGSGVYYINTDGTNDELISQNRAMLYSMIF